MAGTDLYRAAMAAAGGDPLCTARKLLQAMRPSIDANPEALAYVEAVEAAVREATLQNETGALAVREAARRICMAAR